MEQTVADVFEVPELVRETLHMTLAAGLEHDVTCAETCAELVNDPKRPKTNPAIAMAAMSVIAMRITVARTGETAFLRFPIIIFIGKAP